MLIRARDHIKFGFKTTVRYPIVFNLDEILKVVFLSGTLDLDRRALNLHDSIIFDVDLASQALQHSAICVFAIFHVNSGFRRQPFELARHR